MTGCQGQSNYHVVIVLNLKPLSVTKVFQCHFKAQKFSTFCSTSYYWAVLKKRRYLGPALIGYQLRKFCICIKKCEQHRNQSRGYRLHVSKACMLSIASIARRFSTLCIFIINEFLEGIVAGTPFTKKGRDEVNETCPVHRYCVMYAYPMLVDLRNRLVKLYTHSSGLLLQS